MSPPVIRATASAVRSASGRTLAPAAMATPSTAPAAGKAAAERFSAVQIIFQWASVIQIQKGDDAPGAGASSSSALCADFGAVFGRPQTAVLGRLAWNASYRLAIRANP